MGQSGSGGPSATLPPAGHVSNGSSPYGLEGELITPTRTDALVEWVLRGKKYGDPAAQSTGTLAVGCDLSSMMGTLDVAALRRDQEVLFRDACQIGAATYGASPDPQAASWTYGATIICGEDMSKPDETVDGADATITDGAIRVPNGTLVDSTNRIKLVKRDTETLTVAEYYAVVGTPQRGLSCTVCRVKRITGESEL